MRPRVCSCLVANETEAGMMQLVQDLGLAGAVAGVHNLRVVRALSASVAGPVDVRV